MTTTTLHLWRVRPSRVPAAILRMGLDRLLLRTADGLGFHKLVGTGDGRTFGPADADVRTWGLVAVWRDAEAARRFEGHATPRGWRRIAEEEWRADLGCLRTKGEWSGQRPFTVDGSLTGWDGPVAAITRARLRPRQMRRFWRSVPPVVTDLGEDGPLVRVGIGEAPLGLQGTFTVWRDVASLTAFAYQRPAHRQAISDTHRLDWYAEELFARFAVIAQRGTVSGATMVAGPTSGHTSELGTAERGDLRA